MVIIAYYIMHAHLVPWLGSYLKIKYMRCTLCCRRHSKGVEYLVEASAAEAEAISAALAAAKARQVNGESDQLPERDRGAEATPSGKQTLAKIPDLSSSNNMPPPGVRLHHRAVSINMPLLSVFHLSLIYWY